MLQLDILYEPAVNKTMVFGSVSPATLPGPLLSPDFTLQNSFYSCFFLRSMLSLFPGSRGGAGLLESVVALSFLGGVTALLFFVVRLGGIRVNSPYSRMLVKNEKERRVLYFIYDDGRRVLESAMDRRNPFSLVVPYSKVMFAAHLFVPDPSPCLILGLGGGSLVKFYNRFYPGVEVDVVEIDPEVERVARKYFHFTPHPLTRLYFQDAYDYLDSCTRRYHVIHVDAYLKSSEETDSLGVPLLLKSDGFYSLLKRCLHERGVVAINLNSSPHMQRDVEAVRTHFPAVYIFRVPGRSSVVLVASPRKERLSREFLKSVGEGLDRSGVEERNIRFGELPALLMGR